MEVLSLALLAVASGGLLAYKKKQKDDKKKKESFITDNGTSPRNDSLFARAVVGSNGMPEIHNRFVQSAASKFNPLAALFDPSKVNFASNADSMYPEFQAPDNTTVQNMLQTSYTRNETTDKIVFNDALNQKNVSHYRIPNSSNLTNLVNLCELTEIRETPEGADCTVFYSNEFNTQCGICHENAVGTINKSSSMGNSAPNFNVNGPYGLYVSPRLASAVQEQKTQRNTLASLGISQEVFIPSPSLGQCGKDSETNQSYFSLSKDMCKATNKFLKCKKGQDFTNTACYQCSRNNKFYFIDQTDDDLSKRQKTEFDIWGSGQVTIQMDDTMMYLTQPNSNNITSYTPALTTISLRSTRTKFILPFSSNSNISDNNEFESADGKTLIIKLSAINTNAETPYIQGLFLGVLPNTSVKTTDFSITAKAIVGGDEKLPYVSGNPDAYKLYPEISNGTQSRSAEFRILIPYMYMDPTANQKNYCTGPFIRNANVATKLNSLCYTSNDRPGNYSQECLQQMFIAGGCTNLGSGYPNNATKSSDLNRGSNGLLQRNLGDITSHVTAQYKRAWSGKDTNQSNLPISEWLDSIKYCINSSSTSTDPCELLPPSVQRGDPGAAPVSDQCIRHLYENSTRREGFVTYSNVNARSLFDRPGSNDRYCTEFGLISPLSNASNIALAQNIGQGIGQGSNQNKRGIDAIKDFYNNIHSKANTQNMTNAERNEFMQKCYGKTLTVQADADPTIVNGMQVAQTSCGVKARYIRLEHTDKHIMINQIMAYDARGQDVALHKNVTSSSLADNHVLYGAVDAEFDNRFKSSNNGAQWCQIDLNGIYDIVQVLYYNTHIVDEMNQASGMRIMLLDSNQTNIPNTTKVLTNARVQFLDYKSSTANASCPSMYNGRRGNLFSPVLRAENIILTAQGIYPVYNIEKPPTWQEGIGTAKWIWNEPYAGHGGNASAQDVSFTCIINNSTNSMKAYTFFYRASSTPTILFNNVSQTVSGNDSSASTNPASISITLLPGSNSIQVTVIPVANNAAGFIAAFSPVSTGPPTYEKITLGLSTDWKSITSPTLGSYSMPGGIEESYVLFAHSGSSANFAAINQQPNIKPIWNQPDALYGAAVGTVIFYLSFVVSGTNVKNYSIFIEHYGTTLEKIEVNSKDFGRLFTFQVVPGTNIIKVSVSNGGSVSKPAGIIMYIRDDTSNIIAETQNSTNWKVLRDINWINNGCIYGTGSNLSPGCAAILFSNAGCSQPFSSEFYPDRLKGMTSNALLAEYVWNWAWSHNPEQFSNCRGVSHCDNGYTYDSGYGCTIQCNAVEYDIGPNYIYNHSGSCRSNYFMSDNFGGYYNRYCTKYRIPSDVLQLMKSPYYSDNRDMRYHIDVNQRYNTNFAFAKPCEPGGIRMGPLNYYECKYSKDINLGVGGDNGIWATVPDPR